LYPYFLKSFIDPFEYLQNSSVSKLKSWDEE
jgi:hypothetical protein